MDHFSKIKFIIERGNEIEFLYFFSYYDNSCVVYLVTNSSESLWKMFFPQDKRKLVTKRGEGDGYWKYLAQIRLKS